MAECDAFRAGRGVPEASLGSGRESNVPRGVGWVDRRMGIGTDDRGSDRAAVSALGVVWPETVSEGGDSVSVSAGVA